MKRILRAIRLFVLTGGLFLALGMHVAMAGFIFDLTGTAGPDGGTGQIDLTALSGGLAQLGSFNFTNKSFLASSVPGGISYQYGTSDVSSLSYSITGGATGGALKMDLETNLISGSLPPSVDAGIKNHIVFGSQGGALPANGFASGSNCSNPGPQGCSAFFQGTFSSSLVSATAPPPSVQTLAKLGFDTYGGRTGAQGPQGADGYTFVSHAFDNNGFLANAYRNENQVVISIRGTTLGLGLTTAVKSLLADQSFIAGQPTEVLTDNTRLAVAFLRSIASDPAYKDTQITLTGHSLGGAIAQMMGTTAGLRTVTFDAPGGSQLLNPLSSVLAPVKGLGNIQSAENYRLYGDDVSLFGRQIGNVFTVDPPKSLPKSQIDDDPVKYFLYLHRLDILSFQLNTTGTEVKPGFGGGVPIAIGGNYIVPQNSSASKDLRFLADVLSARFNITLDPPPGIGYQLTEKSGSPFLRSIGFPIVDGVSQWRLSELSGGVWSADMLVSTLNAIMLGADVTGVRFVPLDANGLPIFIEDQFPFSLSFDSVGVFDATLTVDTTTPEPTTLLLWGTTMAGLGLATRWRQLRRKQQQ